MPPNPSLERDLHRQGTWPARRSLSSSASRAKHLPGSGPSAQTLGPAGINSAPAQADQGSGAGQFKGFSAVGTGAASSGTFGTSDAWCSFCVFFPSCGVLSASGAISSPCFFLSCRTFLSWAISRGSVIANFHSWCPGSFAHQTPAAGRTIARRVKDEVATAVGTNSVGQRRDTVNAQTAGYTPSQRAWPNPSLEPTRTGMALGPQARGSYHRPRGPSAIPALAPQLKR